MKFTAYIRRNGDVSLGVVIPLIVVRNMKLKENQPIEVEINEIK